ncbi:MAG: phosphonate C-P lyase system protein PhnG, partial [Alphaproteobacteria bacterium]|nr:phosphonate C-P lyase system protein PhnG [Alphaproteobacteria bacterium]
MTNYFWVHKESPPSLSESPGTSIADRQFWISVLSRSSLDELRHYWIEQVYAKEDFANRYTYVRQPEVGLIMARGQAGGQGQEFNMGEVSVTRCSILLDKTWLGHAFAIGRDRKHAEFAALFDALLQQPNWRGQLWHHA